MQYSTAFSDALLALACVACVWLIGRARGRYGEGDQPALFCALLGFLLPAAAACVGVIRYGFDPSWQPAHLWLIAGVGIAGALGQYAITEAFRLGEASLLAPLEYTALVWGVAFDLALWGVLPDAITWLGAGIIVASGLYLLRRERVHLEAEHP